MKILPRPEHKPDLFDLYFHGLEQANERITSSVPAFRKYLPQWLFYALKTTSLLLTPADYEEATKRLGLYKNLLGCLGKLTPSQLAQTFPITKDYDGKKRGEKDYFTTVEAIEAHGWDNPIGSHAFDFLWEYVNPDIQELLVGMLTVMSQQRRLAGFDGLIEDFFEIEPLPEPVARRPFLRLV